MVVYSLYQNKQFEKIILFFNKDFLLFSKYSWNTTYKTKTPFLILLFQFFKKFIMTVNKDLQLLF